MDKVFCPPSCPAEGPDSRWGWLLGITLPLCWQGQAGFQQEASRDRRGQTALWRVCSGPGPRVTPSLSTTVVTPRPCPPGTSVLL